MAVLEKIRKRTVFLILVIGLALFAFVISGIFNSPTSRDQLVIGSVNGDKISYMDFSTQVENTMRNMGGGISQGYIVMPFGNKPYRAVSLTNSSRNWVSP